MTKLNTLKLLLPSETITFEFETFESASSFSFYIRRFLNQKHFEVSITSGTYKCTANHIGKNNSDISRTDADFEKLELMRETSAKYKLFLKIDDTELCFYTFGLTDLNILIALLKQGMNARDYSYTIQQKPHKEDAWEVYAQNPNDSL